jgi:hypothetical protein
VHAIAGDARGAIPHLEAFVRSCSGDSFLLYVHALVALGHARAEVGDVSGACDAYARILGHWGSAKPKSISADEARAQRARLRCP